MTPRIRLRPTLVSDIVDTLVHKQLAYGYNTSSNLRGCL
jgi:hypothetical protein